MDRERYVDVRACIPSSRCVALCRERRMDGWRRIQQETEALPHMIT